jgi:hypothetical protein
VYRYDEEVLYEREEDNDCKQPAGTDYLRIKLPITYLQVSGFTA